jgi:hypothetical protein
MRPRGKGVSAAVRLGWAAPLCCALLLAACGGAESPAIQDLSRKDDLSFFKLGTLHGTRDGDRLEAQAMFSDTSSMLTMELRFHIGSPTTLEAGEWKWTRNSRYSNGAVAARSVTFLGGQDGPPSIGGTFDLLDPNGSPRYRVQIPVLPLKAGTPSSAEPAHSCAECAA